MLFTVNTEVCTRCGLCVADCPTGLLVMTDDGPKTGKGGCISCGHCVAVCPTLALDSDLTPRAEQVDITKETKFTPEQAELFLRSRRSIRNYQNKPVPAELIRKVLNVARMAPTATNTQGISYIVIRDKQKLTPEQAELFLRSRRSIRNYQNKPVPAELIRKVLNVARMAPTATNTQGISYIVIRDKQKLRRIADLVLEWMHLAAKTVPIMRLYARAAQAEVDKGKEYILRDAPALVVAIGSKKDIHRTHDSGHSCLSYAELYAPTLGLGTCWAGFFEHAGEAEYEPLLELLGVPDDKIIAGGILMGYPKVRYRNIVERQPLDVTFDTEE